VVVIDDSPHPSGDQVPSTYTGVNHDRVSGAIPAPKCAIEDTCVGSYGASGKVIRSERNLVTQFDLFEVSHEMATGAATHA
jgi:hypothetical protein